MNTGQMMLVAGALTLLSLLAVSINQMLVGQTQTQLDAEASLNAISVAQSLLDEIQTKYYDAAVMPVYQSGTWVTPRVYDNQIASTMTASIALGPNSAEQSAVPLPDSTYPHKSVAGYGDVDDYNGYVRIDSTSRMNGFRSVVKVYYTVDGSPDNVSNVPTCFKRIDVTVTQQSMKHPLTLSDVAIYRKYF